MNAYWVAVALAQQEHPQWRMGQAAFNVLWQMREDLARRAQAETALNPWHCTHADQSVFRNFSRWLEENW